MPSSSKATEWLDEATPPPWRVRRSIHGPKYRHVQIGKDEMYTTLDLKPADAALIVYAVNRLPDHEAAVDALQSLADAATALENRAIRSGGEFHVWAEERMVTEARDVARAVLRRLRPEDQP